MKARGKEAEIDAASDIAVQALVFLAQDMDRLGQFLALSGLDPSRIREAAQDPGFLTGVLDHLLADEKLLVAFAANSGLRPERVAEARAALSGPSLH